MKKLTEIKSWSVPEMPDIKLGDNIGRTIANKIKELDISLVDGDIIAVASKIVSIAEGRLKNLAEVEVSDAARVIHEKIPRKDPRTIQAIIDETGAFDGSRINLGVNYISGWLPNGMRLTSAGVDKLDKHTVALLPKLPNQSAKSIGMIIKDMCSARVGVIITDSDGRDDREGATQICIGLYGVSPIRLGRYEDEDKMEVTTKETACDMLAAMAGLHMGQRGTKTPVVIISGYKYNFNENATIEDGLTGLQAFRR